MTPAFTVTITADSPEQLTSNLRALLPKGDDFFSLNMPFQDLLLLVEQRVSDEGYEMEVWKKGERETAPVPATGTDRKKEEARAKLRGDLVASLAEATHATAPVKDDIEEAFENEKSADPVAEGPAPADAKTPAPKKARAAKGNGKAETADQIKARTILKLQELYSGGKKAEVNKILAQFGEGSKTFSSIPAEQFAAIAEAAEAI